MIRRFLAAVLIGAGCAVPAHSADIDRLTHSLTFAAPDAAENAAFYEVLAEQVGKIVYLDLSIRPAQGGEGYALTHLGKSNGAPSRATSCGQTGALGMLDNVASMILVGTGHPAHNHAPTEIYVGDRLRFPHQEILCSTEGYTEARFTPLIVRGYFAVQAADIPTAMEYRLTPANP